MSKYDRLNVGDTIIVLNNDLEVENILEFTNFELAQNKLFFKTKNLVPTGVTTARGVEFSVEAN